MRDAALSVRDLRVELCLSGEWRAAVDGVSFDLRPGESLAVVGETGCGKTLLGRALVNLAPEGSRVSGSIRCGGREIVNLPEEAWEKIRGGSIGLVFQEPTLDGYLSADQNLRFHGELYGVDKATAAARRRPPHKG